MGKLCLSHCSSHAAGEVQEPRKCPWKFWGAGAESKSLWEGPAHPQGLRSSISGGAASTPEGEEGAKSEESEEISAAVKDKEEIC